MPLTPVPEITSVTGTFTSARVPVASGSNSLTNSSFIMSGGNFDLASAGQIILGGAVATSIAIGNANTTGNVTFGSGINSLFFSASVTSGNISALTQATGSGLTGVLMQFGFANGAVASGSTHAGAGGQTVLSGGGGGAATTTAGGTAAAGGQCNVNGGNGGAGAATTNAAGAGGPMVVAGGAAGANNGAGGAAGGNCFIRGGLGTNGTNGAVVLGDVNTSGIQVGPNQTFTSWSQAATNTVGLTIAPNVATGASSIALALNSASTLSSGKIVSIQNNGTEKAYFDFAGNLVLPVATAGVLDSSTARGIIFNVNANHDVAIVGSSINFIPDVDNTVSLGSAGNSWTGVNAYKYVTKSQANTMSSATQTINPATAFVKMTYQSATNVTSMTISAGVDGQELVVALIQPASGTAATMTTTWTNVSFAGGSPTFTATLGKRDIYTFMYDGTTSKWYEIGRAVNLPN